MARLHRQVRLNRPTDAPPSGSIAELRTQLRIVTKPEATMSLSATEESFESVFDLYQGMVGTLYRPRVLEELYVLMAIIDKFGGNSQPYAERLRKRLQMTGGY